MRHSPGRAPSFARGCVLAGGAGRRMGAAKAKVTLVGRPLIAHPLAALRLAGLDPVVVAKAGSELPPLDVEVWLESRTPHHPLAGIVAALRRVRATGGTDRAILVCACDMPFVTAELCAWLAALPHPLVVPRLAGRPEPLLARYGVELLEPLTEALERELSLGNAVTALSPRWVDEAELRRFGEPTELLANVNTPAELAVAELAVAERAYTRPR